MVKVCQNCKNICGHEYTYALIRMLEDTIGIVIDAGSKNCKAGFAGESSPRVIFPTTVGRFHNGNLLLDGVPVIYCGHEAIRNRGISNLVWPVQEGLIKNWDEMEKLWHNIFYKELHVPPETTKIMHAVHPLIPKDDMQIMTELMFEMFTVRELYLGKSPALSLFASGRTTGLVYENGHECSYIAPVYEGFHLQNATVVSHITGKVMTNRLRKLLLNMGNSFTTAFETDLLNKIKKDLCFVAQDYEQEKMEIGGCIDNKIKYQLPDGQHILIGEKRIEVAEALFQPGLEPNNKSKNLIDAIITSIDLCDLDHRKMFFKNMIFSGGSTLFPGLVERVHKELTLKLQGFKPIIDAPISRQYSSWAGGSMLASLSNLKGFWLTKQEYEDLGSERVLYKFF